jgi:2,4-dienoyl-CoA reductase-like NADH-dependent reductase (Old Yellow Enzyme family)
MNERLSQVFSPLEVRNVTLKNRVFSTGHMTCLPDGAVTDRLVAYHEARARGGRG